MHKHAKLIMEWAQMMQMPKSEWRQIEFREHSGEWNYLEIGIAPAFIDTNEYRWKPRTIKIGDIDVPEPDGIWKYENAAISMVFENMESCEIAYAALKSLTQKKE